MDCLFCKIIAQEIEAKRLFETEKVLVIPDLYPQAPTHCLLLPKKHIATIDDATVEDKILLGEMILTAQKIAKDNALDEGYRLVFNVNSGGGQCIYHIHLHLLGGRQMQWPPG
ncbi:MAG: histidine triad nucleotide-binding protein [Legionella sp.]|nr:histidine triad nucleotide-binding protein [Legionella sp.]